jgi:hypothetical protein
MAYTQKGLITAAKTCFEYPLKTLNVTNEDFW